KAKRGAGIPSPHLEPAWVPPDRLDAGGPDLVHRLFGRCLRHRLYRYEDAAFGFGTELNLTVDKREQGMGLAKADILARVPLGAPLTGHDAAGGAVLRAGQAHAHEQAARGAAL